MKPIKKKSLFDHINQITKVQNPNYWDEISKEDKKSWSNYMVNRFLSMKTDWIEVVNELQKYNLQPKELYKLYTNILPKTRQWLKYTKGKNEMSYPNWMVNIIVNNEAILPGIFVNLPIPNKVTNKKIIFLIIFY